MKLLIKFIKVVLFLLFPPTCIHCNCLLNLENLLLCSACKNQILTYKDHFCKRCGRGLYHYNNNYTPSYCNKCLHLIGKKQLLYISATAIVSYTNPMKKLIHLWKYKHNYHAAKLLQKHVNQFLNAHFHLFSTIDYIIPVPLHPSKERKREFNQAEELAKWVSFTYNIPVIKNVLIRKKKTVPLNTLDLKERKHALQDAFSIHNRPTPCLQNKSCLLVDDIFTTGITIETCAQQLMLTGISKLHILTLASK